MNARRPDPQRERSIQAKWAEVEAKAQRLRELLAARGDRIVEGDVLHLDASGDAALSWTVLHVHADDADLLRCVPLDSNDLAGTSDVHLPSSSLVGPAALRCGLPVWIRRESLDARMRDGLLEPWDLQRVVDKVQEIRDGRVSGSASQREADADLDLRERLVEVEAARDAVHAWAHTRVPSADRVAEALQRLCGSVARAFDLRLPVSDVALASGGTSEWDEDAGIPSIWKDGALAGSDAWPYLVFAISEESSDHTELVVTREDERSESIDVSLVLTDGTVLDPEGGAEQETGDRIRFAKAGRKADIAHVVIVPLPRSTGDSA